MKFSELIDGLNEPQSAEQMLNVLKTVLMADDVSGDERGAMACGFMIGASFVLGKINEGSIEEAAIGFLRMMQVLQETVFDQLGGT